MLQISTEGIINKKKSQIREDISSQTTFSEVTQVAKWSHNCVNLVDEFTLDNFQHTCSKSNNCYETWPCPNTKPLHKCRIWENNSLFLYLKSLGCHVLILRAVTGNMTFLICFSCFKRTVVTVEGGRKNLRIGQQEACVFFETQGRHASAKAQEAVDHLASFCQVEEISRSGIKPPTSSLKRHVLNVEVHSTSPTCTTLSAIS